ncbi:MAG TPA: hypothetical protein VF584_16145 [Longimicrobium sp.]
MTGVVIGRGTDPAYARSFLDAALHLTTEVAKPTPSAYHTLAIPALYCFRHALELMLKAVLREVDAVLTPCPAPENEPAPPSANAARMGTHSLVEVERELTIKLQHHGYDFLIDRHRATVKRVHDLDPAGMSFRYGLNKKGQLLLPVGWEVQIREVEAAVTEVFEQLDLIWWVLQGFALSNPVGHQQMWSY